MKYKGWINVGNLLLKNTMQYNICDFNVIIIIINSLELHDVQATADGRAQCGYKRWCFVVVGWRDRGGLSTPPQQVLQ